MEFYGTITNIIGGTNSSVFTITELGSDKKWNLEIVHILPPKPLPNGNIDLCLDCNLLLVDEAIDKKRHVHVEVHDIAWDGSSFTPQAYIGKQVYVYPAS